MQLVINQNIILTVIENPVITEDLISFTLSPFDIQKIPESISGEIILQEYINWPKIEENINTLSNEIEETSIFELYKTDMEQWSQFYLNGNTINFSKRSLKNIPLVEKEIDLESIKQKKINDSQQKLQEFLQNHPLEWKDGKTYSVTSEKLSRLLNKINFYQSVKEMDKTIELTWNATGEVSRLWSIEDLADLAIEIMNYIDKLVQYQQEYEILIKSCSTLNDLNNCQCNYYTVYPNLIPKDHIGIGVKKEEKYE